MIPLRTLNDARDIASLALQSLPDTPGEARAHVCPACERDFNARRTLLRHLNQARCPTVKEADKHIQHALLERLSSRFPPAADPPSPSTQTPLDGFAITLTMCAPEAVAKGPVEPGYNRVTTWLRFRVPFRPYVFWASAPALRTVHSGRALLKRIERGPACGARRLPRASDFALVVRPAGLVVSVSGVHEADGALQDTRRDVADAPSLTMQIAVSSQALRLASVSPVRAWSQGWYELFYQGNQVRGPLRIVTTLHDDPGGALSHGLSQHHRPQPQTEEHDRPSPLQTEEHGCPDTMEFDHDEPAHVSDVPHAIPSAAVSVQPAAQYSSDPSQSHAPSAALVRRPAFAMAPGPSLLLIRCLYTFQNYDRLQVPRPIVQNRPSSAAPARHWTKMRMQ